MKLWNCFFLCSSRFPSQVKDLEKLITEEETAQGADSAALKLGREVMARPGGKWSETHADHFGCDQLVASTGHFLRLLLFLGKNLYYCEEVCGNHAVGFFWWCCMQMGFDGGFERTIDAKKLQVSNWLLLFLCFWELVGFGDWDVWHTLLLLLYTWMSFKFTENPVIQGSTIHLQDNLCEYSHQSIFFSRFGAPTFSSMSSNGTPLSCRFRELRSTSSVRWNGTWDHHCDWNQNRFASSRKWQCGLPWIWMERNNTKKGLSCHIWNDRLTFVHGT